MKKTVGPAIMDNKKIKMLLGIECSVARVYIVGEAREVAIFVGESVLYTNGITRFTDIAPLQVSLSWCPFKFKITHFLNNKSCDISFFMFVGGVLDVI